MSVQPQEKMEDQIALIAAQTAITDLAVIIVILVCTCKKVSEHLSFLLLGWVEFSAFKR